MLRTDILGKYLFEGLTPGDYYLSFDPPGIYSATDITVQDPMSTDVSHLNGENHYSSF